MAEVLAKTGGCFASGAGMTPGTTGANGRKIETCADLHHTRPLTTTNTKEKDGDEDWMPA